MTPERCKNCPALIYPYIYTVDKHNHKLPEEEWMPTCSKNMAQGIERGMHDRCCPEICEGPNGRRYYVDYVNSTPENIKVIYETRR